MTKTIKAIIATLLIFPILSYAGHKEGEEIFSKKCSSCHVSYIPADKIKENFFDKNNTLLKLDAPTVNMLAYAIMDSPKHIGDPSDPEMQQMEIEEYLLDYLYNPKMENSICDDTVMGFYKVKESLKGKVTADEIVDLAIFFMNYKKMRRKNRAEETKKPTKKKFSPKQVLEDAVRHNKKIIIEASSSTCHFCKKMKQEVLSKKSVQNDMGEDFIFVEIDIDKTHLPFSLQKHFKGITPTFFFLSKNGKLLNSYPGSWSIENWNIILNENRKKR